MVKALLFFLAVVLASSYLTDILVYFPLNFLELLQGIFGYIPLAIGLIGLIWFLDN